MTHADRVAFLREIVRELQRESHRFSGDVLQEIVDREEEMARREEARQQEKAAG